MDKKLKCGKDWRGNSPARCPDCGQSSVPIVVEKGGTK